MPGPVELIVYSDFLCPWCYNAAVRIHQMEDEFGDDLVVTWRSYLLRPVEKPRNPEKFRRYTQGWQVPGAEPDSGTFQPWTGDAAPPSHSVPPHLVAKAAATLGKDAYRRVHDGLLRAYFAESRDITDDEVLRAVWQDAGLEAADFQRRDDPAHLAATMAEHEEAPGRGVNGVPAAAVAGNDTFVTGAFPAQTWRRWIERARDRGV